MKQGVWWVQPLKVWVIIFCKVWKWHLMQELMFYCILISLHWLFCTPWSCKEEGYALLAPLAPLNLLLKEYNSFVCIPTAIIITLFNYMIITYRYLNIRSWDKDHSTQHEMVIPTIYKNMKANYSKIAITWLKTFKYILLLTTIIADEYIKILYENDSKIIVLCMW